MSGAATRQARAPIPPAADVSTGARTSQGASTSVPAIEATSFTDGKPLLCTHLHGRYYVGLLESESERGRAYTRNLG